MIRYRRLAAVVTTLTLAVGCTSQEDRHWGVEAGDDNSLVDGVFASWDLPESLSVARSPATDPANRFGGTAPESDRHPPEGLRERNIMEKSWQQRLEADQIVLIDGATGTELQRRGVPMDEVAWSGAAVLTHPDVVRETHEDYIRAGAEVIITNTFGSTRQMLEPAGYGDQVEAVHRGAVELARQARDNVADQAVAVAGSISTEPPGFDRDAFLSPEKELEAYREAAGLLADAGVDLIALEMIVETNHGSRALQAALETKLPVWLGVGCKKTEDGKIVSFDHTDLEFATVLDALIPMGPTVVNIMHSEIGAIPEAIELVRQRWSGSIGVYPESGYFTKPNWNFVDVIAPADLVTEALGWVATGVRLLGGCCGTNPDHIKALQAATPELELKRHLS